MGWGRISSGMCSQSSDQVQAEDAILFLWTTLSTLPHGLELLSFWGFLYHITITWDKGAGFCMSGFNRRTELVLVGYKGQ
jgi:N6-adenosine-specific RNA methylase IME4